MQLPRKSQTAQQETHNSVVPEPGEGLVFWWTSTVHAQPHSTAGSQCWQQAHQGLCRPSNQQKPVSNITWIILLPPLMNSPLSRSRLTLVMEMYWEVFVDAIRLLSCFLSSSIRFLCVTCPLLKQIVCRNAFLLSISGTARVQLWN